ncbi:MAG: hypothetical protein R3B91_05440 [Planctomycetaceae bacterium]
MSDTPQDEPILYEAHPAMFRNNPVWFVICVLLSFVVVGLILLLIWYLQTRATTLIVTNEQTTLRKDFSPGNQRCVPRERPQHPGETDVLSTDDGVGYVGISSSGQSGLEIEVNGIPDPDRVKEIIDEHRHTS